jgi:hypothetical protein
VALAAYVYNFVVPANNNQSKCYRIQETIAWLKKVFLICCATRILIKAPIQSQKVKFGTTCKGNYQFTAYRKPMTLTNYHTYLQVSSTRTNMAANTTYHLSCKILAQTSKLSKTYLKTAACRRFHHTAFTMRLEKNV